MYRITVTKRADLYKTHVSLATMHSLQTTSPQTDGRNTKVYIWPAKLAISSLAIYTLAIL